MESIVMLALDVGASGGKAIAGILDLKENKLVTEELYRFPNFMVRVGSHLHWNILYIWSEIKNAVKVAVKKYGSKLASVGIDTWGVDFTLLDDREELVGLPYTYRDKGSEFAMEEVLARIPRKLIYARTGIQFTKINTLYQLYALAKNNPSKLKMAKTFLMIPDLLNYWLTGVKASEYTEASTTQFLDPRTRSWCYDILETLNIPTSILPEIVDAGTMLGHLDKNLAEELSIPKEVYENLAIVAPATHDTASAIAAGPMVDENAGYISSGTWNLVGIELKEPLINDMAMEYNFANEGGAFKTITFLRNMQGMWILQEVKRILAEVEGKEYSYDELVKMATEADNIESFIDVDHPNFLAPTNMVNEILKYLDATGQQKPKNVNELIRIIVNSLALKHRLIFDKAVALKGKRLTHINIFGGGSKNNLLNQLTANVLKIPVYAGPAEATSAGNILIQASGLGVIRSLSELRKTVKNSFDIKIYHPEDEETYEDLYSKYISKIRPL
ncbi:MAG: rhamnulokinase [Nitrososphaeria archaeon]